MLLYETFPVGPFAANCTVLACADTKQGVIIDPGGGIAQIDKVVDHHDLTITAVIHTHGHLDHVTATAEAVAKFGGDTYLHKADLPTYRAWPGQAVMFGLTPGKVIDIDHYLEDGDTITFGKRELAVIHTPGHSPGSVCFKLEDEGRTLVFSGDTLFRRGIGRTDLPGGDSHQLFASIRDRLYKLPPDSRVIPGHGDPTTISEEMAENPFVRA